MLVTTVGMSTPCTFQVIVSRSFTPSSPATLVSSETSPRLSRAVPANHLPATMFSDSVSVSR